MNVLESLIPLMMGVGLAAACGFRVFVPLLVVSLAAKTGYISLDPGWGWLGQWPAVVCLGVATVLEIAAYYVPWLDNLLDSISTPGAVVAGTIVSATFITDMDPLLKWALAAILGGGVAGAVQVTTVGLRGVSSAGTLGLANPLVATGEWLGAVSLSLLALAVPVLALTAILGALVLLGRKLLKRRRAGMLAAPPAPIME